MMGLGSLGSSNLSPLAPPFTVDRSNHNKPPVSHFNHPSYALPFNSSWPYSHSPTVAQQFLPDSPRTTALPSDDYGYIIPEPTATHNWSAVNPSPKRVTDSSSYSLGEPKPLYPPYTTNDDVPLVTFSEPTYELLSTSGLVHGDQTSQVDYTRSLSGLEYKEGVWSGLSLPEGRKRESHDSFFSEDPSIAAYTNYLNQGAYAAGTLSKAKDDPSMFCYADIIRRENNVGPSINGKSVGTPFSDEFSKGGSTFRAFPMFSESHPLIQSPEPPEEPWNAKTYSLYEERFPMFGCSNGHMPPPIKEPSSLVIKPSSFMTQGPSSSKSLEIADIAALNISDVVGSHHKPLKEKELHLPQDLKSSASLFAPNQLSFQIGRANQHTCVSPPSTSSTKLFANDQLNFEFKARPTFQVPDINIPENVKSAATSFDHHNPAEDSPCWKGAPTSHFLPLGSPEAESPQPPTKKLQTGNGVDLQGSQTDYSFNNYSRVHDLGESDDKTLGSIPVKKEHTGEVVNVGFNSAKASSGGGAQSVCDTINSKKGHGSLDESTSDANLQTSKLKLPNPEEDVISPEMKIQLVYGDVDHTIRALEHVLVSSVKDTANLATAKKLNASILIKALNNLSDLLLLHCSKDEFALKEHDREALGHVIGNLDLCMSREVQVASTHKLIFPQQNTYNNVSQEGAYVGKSQVMNEHTGIFHDDRAGQHCTHHQKHKSDIIGKNVEKLSEGASLKDEADPAKHHNMVQAIKKVLDENLECKVELASETLLYKNLWLEAEAEVCSLNYRARFERMKRVVDKSRDAAGMMEISSCNGSTNPNIPPKADGSKDCSAHIDDVEASVMDRLNILKGRGELLNHVDMEEVEVAGVKVCGKGSESVVCKDDVEAWVMKSVDLEEKEVKVNGKERESNKEESGSEWEHIQKEEFSWQLGNGKGKGKGT